VASHLSSGNVRRDALNLSIGRTLDPTVLGRDPARHFDAPAQVARDGDLLRGGAFS
jgi:hypothetical protein